MAGARFSIDTQGLDRLQASVRLMASSVRDTSTLMPRLGEYLQRSTQDRFKTQTDPDGGAWAALQPRTRERKRHNRDKILTQRGYLRKHIYYQVTAPGRVEVFSDRVYAATHQFGRGNIPARPFLGISRRDTEEIGAIVRDWAAEFGFN